MQAQCSICDANISGLDGVEIAEIISCSECHNKLEVISKNLDTKTIEVKEAPKIEEDWGE